MASAGGDSHAVESQLGRLDDREIAVVAEALEEAIKASDRSIFYRAFRASRLPFICHEYYDRPVELFAACFDIVHRLGGVSPAVALAVENHFYVTSAIATFPAAADPALERRRRRLIETIATERLLVANTNSKVHSVNIGEIGTLATRDGASLRVNGEAAYTSLASEADLLILLTELKGEGAVFIEIPTQSENPSVEIGPYLFPNAMLDSDTRRITFHDVRLPADALIAATQSRVTNSLVPFEMTWHQLLIPALYLGAALRAIEEVRSFLVATKGRDGQSLASLDGMVVDVGRLALEYQSARCLVHKAADALADVQEIPRDEVQVERAVHLAGAAKYTGTRAAESIVTAARRVVGARSFVGNSVLERLSNEVMFASLGPEVSAVLERRYGKLVLENKFFQLLS
nr:acyl-CoA dehydrogenase family protein [Bradyrhizobium sp. 188]